MVQAALVVAAVVDEEYRFRGVQALLKEGWGAQEVVVGEPTRLQVVRAHKGAMRWRLAVQGKAAHSSTPELGDNAIYKIKIGLELTQLKILLHKALQFWTHL